MAEVGVVEIGVEPGEGHEVMGPGGFEFRHGLYRVRLWAGTAAVTCTAVLASAIMLQMDERPEWVTLAFGVAASLLFVPAFYMMCVAIALNYMVRK